MAGWRVGGKGIRCKGWEEERREEAEEREMEEQEKEIKRRDDLP